MKAEDLTKEIYDEFPKAWELIKSYLLDNGNYEFFSIDVYNNYNVVGVMVGNIGRETYLCSMPFNMLYALLEDFFEENGIDIYIMCNYIDSVHKGYEEKRYLYKVVWLDEVFETFNNREYVDQKNEAKYQAILKACEILRKNIGGVNEQH